MCVCVLVARHRSCAQLNSPAPHACAQLVTCDASTPASASFTLTFRGESTAAIAGTAAVADVEAALEALTT